MQFRPYLQEDEWIIQAKADSGWVRHGTMSFNLKEEAVASVNALSEEELVLDPFRLMHMIESGRSHWFAYKVGDRLIYFAAGMGLNIPDWEKPPFSIEHDEEVYTRVGKVDLETGVIYAYPNEDEPVSVIY